MQPTTCTDKNTLHAIYAAKNINLEALKVVFRLGELAQDCQRFLEQLCSSESASVSDNWPSSSKFIMNEEQRAQMILLQHARHSRSESTTTSSGGTPQRPSNGNRTVVGSSDLFGIFVLKSWSKYELVILRMAEICSSRCFPQLIAFTQFPEDAMLIELELERIDTLRKWIHDLEDSYCDFSWLQKQFATFLIQLAEALCCLHSAGFVHGDVSINNVGFNQRLNHWQIFDFNQSRPIAIAATNHYRGGTRGFRSASYEATGLFTLKDDFISLLLTAKHAFSKFTAVQRACDAFFQPFSALLSWDSMDTFNREIDLLKEQAELE